MATHRISLAQQIAEFDEPAPVELDPEDVQITGVDPKDEAPADPSAEREHYFDVGPSALRKLHDSISDPKYEGVHTTRKQLMEDSDVGVDEEGTDGVGDNEPSGGSEEEGGDAEDEDISSHSEPGEESDVEQPNGYHPPSSKTPAKDAAPTEDLSSTLRQTQVEDRRKGKAVSRQIALWDSLLDARIRLQKSVAAANRLPTPSHLLQFTNSPECRESLEKMLEETSLLSNELFELQEDLLTSNESITPPPRKRRKIQTDETSRGYDSHLRDASQAASALEHTFHPYLIQTLSKWSSKIQAVAPSVLLPSNRNAFSSKHSQHLKSVTQLLDETLTDHAKMLQRTRVPRGKGRRLGVTSPHGEDSGKEDEDLDVDMELFDDTDFYQQLLRDVIDAKGNEVEGRDDWMVMQKQKKEKKNVDTKASKGRKLRHEVHEKLQNFMVPVPVQGAWHDEQVDELFVSLLGKGFEGSALAVGLNGDVETRLEEQMGEALKGGFRVFG